ncbi:thioredoxin family protein [Salinirubellus salinus]|uniref:Thioredoxin family protein n=1 Tax=Salinirubellus salinus TaxID=1364945 RepID=A0A9E7R2A1_9EURY|nr:thioredoxin family protein [Salinirubellus salinus]UWM54440.1 thioredoxin family protein [Salinirubellus salinus]
MDADAAADSGALLDRLLDEAVVEPATEGDRLRLTDGFTDRLDAVRTTVEDLDSSALREHVSAVVDDAAEVDALVDAGDHDEALLVGYLAVAESVQSFTHADRLRVLPVVDALCREPPAAHGSPAAFTPVHGDRLPFLLRVHPEAVVYIWLDDCRDCDEMRTTLDELYHEAPDDIAFFSVYGPDSPRLLKERFEVPGGPATLFVHGGTVDARLYGSQYESVIESELQTLRAMASA